jgi:hypothetical protein
VCIILWGSLSFPFEVLVSFGPEDARQKCSYVLWEKQLGDELAAERSKAGPKAGLPRSGTGCRPRSGEGQLLTTTVPFRGGILDQLAGRG